MKNSIPDQMIRSLALIKKDVMIYYSKGPVLLMGLLLPAIMFISFAFGRGMKIEVLMPGLIGVCVFFTCSAITPVAFPWETAQKTLERLISMPVAVWTILFGDMLASAAVGIVLSIVPVLIALGFGVNFTNPLLLALAIVAGALCFATMALLISIPPVSAPQYTQTLSALIKFPLLFISGIFIPLIELPTAAITISLVSPLTYFTDIARYAFGQGSVLPLYVDFLALIAFTALFWFIAVRMHNRTLPKRL